MTPYTREQIENWASDFCGSDAIHEFPMPVREAAPTVLVTFLAGACDGRGIEPHDIEEADLKSSLLGPVARLGLPGDIAAQVPALCAAYLAHLETEGRVGGARLMGAFVRALAEPFSRASGGKQKPVVRPGAKLNPNGPCPCGSGKKYKKCCMT